ncbi:phage antirepressor KilAC domain-containing protein [Frankia sp. R82]|uniref:phage antirepressor n=1 Tax=Frankia sp. R82 TaxID=2950553 RepID=UPI00204384A0|nr:phage antirepressor KilAC domain-containing protein [Frankia sp. R82]MCM3884118.1 phage antirepressor KilAC domain-containing protein [Frankia sp. R82]
MTAREIVPFAFEGHEVRAFLVDDEPWWVAKDVTDILGYRIAGDATRWLDDDEKGTHPVRTPGGLQNLTVVSEPGLYKLILRSRAKKAQAFTRWVTHEVLPEIRRTGRYEITPAPAPALPDMTTPEGRRAVAQALLAGAEREIELTTRVAELEPKALAHDTYLSAPEGGRLVREVAKILGWKERDLRAFLADEKLIYRRQNLCGATQWDFYAKNADHFRAVERVIEHTWGSCPHYTLYVTPRGVDLIHKRIAGRASALRELTVSSAH